MPDQEQLPQVPVPTPRVGAAISWAFDTFRRNPLPYIALAAVVAVIQVVQQIGSQSLTNALVACQDPQSPGQQNACDAALGISAIGGFIVTLVFLVLAFFATIGVYRAALANSQGREPEFTMIFSTENLGRYVLFSLAYAGLTIVGVILCIIPGLIVAFLLQLGPVFVLDRGYRPVAAIKASYRVITKNLGPAFVMVLFAVLVSLLGSTFYGILTLLTLPFTTLFVVHMYRQFNGEPVR
jgi:uncharacterized membrane protein